MDLHLKDKVAIVTGGAKGIGEAIVRAFAAEGAIPVVFDRNPDVAQELLSELGTGFQFDVELSDEANIKDAVKMTLAATGRIDTVVNNAGVNDSVTLEKPPSDFMASLRKNLLHVFALVHYALDELKRNKGSIVNVGSKVADTGQGGTSGYAASKGGMNALTREWAVSLAPFGVRANCVVPAEVMTAMYERWLQKVPNPEETLRKIEKTIPLENRFTTAEEIANAVVFLASDRSAHTTGQIIYPDGGYVHLDRAFTSASEIAN